MGKNKLKKKARGTCWNSLGIKNYRERDTQRKKPVPLSHCCRSSLFDERDLIQSSLIYQLWQLFLLGLHTLSK